MKDEIFRKKSLDRMRSPESLDDYIRVSNPGIWLLLISVIVLLIGACVWGIFGHVDSTVPSVVRVENGEAVCFIAEDDIASVQTGLIVRFADREAVISRLGGKEEQGYLCSLTTEETPADGFYEGKVVIDSFRPLSFVLN